MSKVIIVTGASRGIGFEVCRQLADRGHRVVAVARSAQPLQKLQQQYPSLIYDMPADLTGDIHQLVRTVSSTFEGVDVLINNAGALINKSFEELTMEDWQSQINSNLLSAVRVTKAFLPHINTNGHILNISSMGGFQGSTKFPGLSAYSVSKGALSILTECLSVELAGQQISVNALCLGAVQTAMVKEAFPGIKAPVTPVEMGKYIADFSLGGTAFYNGRILPVAMDDPS